MRIHVNVHVLTRQANAPIQLKFSILTRVSANAPRSSGAKEGRYSTKQPASVSALSLTQNAMHHKLMMTIHAAVSVQTNHRQAAPMGSRGMTKNVNVCAQKR